MWKEYNSCPNPELRELRHRNYLDARRDTRKIIRQAKQEWSTLVMEAHPDDIWGGVRRLQGRKGRIFQPRQTPAMALQQAEEIATFFSGMAPDVPLLAVTHHNTAGRSFNWSDWNWSSL